MRELSPGFWNIRGSFEIDGMGDVGTHMSLIRKGDGRFLAIDSYALEDRDRQALLALTDNGLAIDAIINVHPFHTVFCRTMHQLVPEARLIGTRRHHREAPELPWDPLPIEHAECQRHFMADLEFAIPDGVDFVCYDDRVHVASVLVRHRPSRIVHVDDTLNVQQLPGRSQSKLQFHPLLASALQPEAGAADAFASWARNLAERWAETPAVCAAHNAVRSLRPDGWREEVLGALAAVDKALVAHRLNHG
ncbi:hypothetical protein DM806_09780 [Sphingobium lactosutens]|uniref:hypothetical protein n=1 Tax=Sphingobium lactosutens TaxID=522773 RepID=UPI0015BF5BD9|nr:hypothetical protein [Sphingobium lactosutens]NWK95958.1 hypothetical protein [Sphingobium lactosutens]